MKGAGSIVSIDDSASVEDLTQGLDWTQWLLRGVRQRCQGVILPEQPSLSSLVNIWPDWLEKRFIPKLGPALLDAAANHQRISPRELAGHEAMWSALLSSDEAQRSAEAGGQLLRSVRGARHAGALVQLQEASAGGHIQCHIGLVWPVVAGVFQLSPGMMLSEYLRLELQCAGRSLAGLAEEPFKPALVHSVQKVLGDQTLPWRNCNEAVGRQV